MATNFYIIIIKCVLTSVSAKLAFLKKEDTARMRIGAYSVSSHQCTHTKKSLKLKIGLNLIWSTD